MYLGVDIGGTSLKAGLVDDSGKIITTESIRVKVNQTDFDKYIIKNMVDLCEEILKTQNLEKNDIRYVGAGAPGPVDTDNGIFLHAPNLPIKNLHIGERFQDEFGVPLILGNDANCAAVGEYIAGGIPQSDSMVLLTLGTGVGSGFISKGKLWTGCNGIGTEAGHVTIYAGGRLCGCGRRGCLEAYASASALIRDTITYMLAYKDSILWEVAGGLLDNVNGTTVFTAAKMGDGSAQEVLNRYIDNLAEGILNIINILQPDYICLGGGVSNASDDQLIIPLRKRIEGRGMDKYNNRHTQILKAILGNDAGIVGAAMLGNV